MDAEQESWLPFLGLAFYTYIVKKELGDWI